MDKSITMFLQKRLKRIFQYPILALSIFSANINAKEINIQIKAGGYSQLLRISTEKLSEVSFLSFANVDEDVDEGVDEGVDESVDADVIRDLICEPATSSPSSLLRPAMTYTFRDRDHPNLPIIELTSDFQRVINSEISEIHRHPYFNEWNLEGGVERWGFNEPPSEGQRLFRASFQLPFYSIIPLNREEDDPLPTGVSDSFLSIRYYILFTDNILTRLRTEYSDQRGATQMTQMSLSSPNHNMEHHPPVMNEGTENSTSEHQPNDFPPVLQADFAMPPLVSNK